MLKLSHVTSCKVLGGSLNIHKSKVLLDMVPRTHENAWYVQVCKDVYSEEAQIEKTGIKLTTYKFGQPTSQAAIQSNLFESVSPLLFLLVIVV